MGAPRTEVLAQLVVCNQHYEALDLKTIVFAEVIEGVVIGLVGNVSAVEKEIGMAAIAFDL